MSAGRSDKRPPPATAMAGMSENDKVDCLMALAVPRKPSETWECSVCTFNGNSTKESRCRICYSRRPSVAFISDRVGHRSKLLIRAKVGLCHMMTLPSTRTVASTEVESPQPDSNSSNSTNSAQVYEQHRQSEKERMAMLHVLLHGFLQKHDRERLKEVDTLARMFRNNFRVRRIS